MFSNDYASCRGNLSVFSLVASVAHLSLLGEGKEFIFARSKHSLLQYDSVRYEERLLYTVEIISELF